MTKTQLNFELPTGWLSFTSSKVDNSGSTDPLMPADKSPDFYYEGTKADGTTQQVSLYYDIADSYKKKLLVNGITTNLTDDGADDAVTDLSLEGATNPITFIFEVMDENVGYIWNPLDSKMIALQGCTGTCNTIIADATNFEAIYNDITALPAPVDLTILFQTPNPLTGAGLRVKSFTFNIDITNGYLTYTFVRADSSSFTLTVEEMGTPLVENGVTFTKQLTIIDAGATIQYYGTANMGMALTQLSGYIHDAVTGTYTTTTPEPIDFSGEYNPRFDGFRVIVITSLETIDIGGQTIVTNPSDSGIVITISMAKRAEIARHFNRLKQVSRQATAKFLDPLRKTGKFLPKKKK